MTDQTSQLNLSISLKAPQEPSKSPVSPGVSAPEYGGTEGPDPTRYGDWQHKGRCTDF